AVRVKTKHFPIARLDSRGRPHSLSCRYLSCALHALKILNSPERANEVNGGCTMRKLLSLLLLGGLVWSLSLPARAAGPENTGDSLPRDPSPSIGWPDTAPRIKVRFTKRGGIAGFRFEARIDSKVLSAEDARQLRKLIDSAHFFELPATFPDSGIRDGFGYAITIEANGRCHRVNVDEGSVPEKLFPLIDWLSKRAQMRPPRGSTPITGAEQTPS